MLPKMTSFAIFIVKTTVENCLWGKVYFSGRAQEFNSSAAIVSNQSAGPSAVGQTNIHI